MKNALKNSLVYSLSATVGLISGFFGGGGGMLCVPLLRFCGLDEKSSHATALLIILPLCIVSAAIYISNGYFDYISVVCAVIGVTAGGAAGALLLDKLSGTALSLVFAALMIAVGVKLLLP